MPYTTTLQLETVRCNLCHSTDLDAVYDARADLEKDRELVVKFRASSDELLTQPLVRCRQCSLLFVNPRVPAAAMLAAYAEGADPQVRIADGVTCADVFAVSCTNRTTEATTRPAPRRRHGGGGVSAGRTGGGVGRHRHRAEPLARRVGAQPVPASTSRSARSTTSRWPKRASTSSRCGTSSSTRQIRCMCCAGRAAC